MAAYNVRGLNLTGAGQPEMLVTGRVGEGFFDIVRVRPALGRTFLPDEHTPGKNHVLVVSDGFWKKRLGGAPDAVGRTLTLDGDSYTVVGVMPARFSFKSWGVTSLQVWTPLSWDDKERAVRENHNYQVVARLKPGVTLDQAKSELNVISTRLAQQFPAEDAGWGATAIPLQELIVGDVRRSLRHAARRRRPGAAHRLRQRRQPDPRAGARPPQGDWRSAPRSAPDAAACSST